MWVPDETSGEKPRLGTLLEVMHGAGSFNTVHAAFRVWRHTERAQAAFRAAAEEDTRRGASSQTVTLRGRGEEPSERVETIRIWRSGGRVREEQHGGPRDGYYAVRDGDVWWSWDERMGAISNEDDPSVSSGIGEQLSIMLDPTPLLAATRFSVIGRSRVLGRATILAEAVPRESDPRRPPRSFELHQIGSGADRYTIEVDVERGVLLRTAALRGREPFQEITTVEIAFDEPIGDELFRFEPPAGEQVQPIGQRPRPQRITAAEAQQRAPFTVLIPDRVPADWHVNCVFIEPAQRPPQPACVLLSYRSDDGHESVSLSQYAAADKPEQFDLMIASDEWQTITHEGTGVRVRRGGPQSQAHIESDGTFVFVSSETLSGDRLGAIAGALKRAPTDTTT
jgi:outer membrane lipoprotein-sorting protein